MWPSWNGVLVVSASVGIDVCSADFSRHSFGVSTSVDIPVGFEILRAEALRTASDQDKNLLKFDDEGIHFVISRVGVIIVVE